ISEPPTATHEAGECLRCRSDAETRSKGRRRMIRAVIFDLDGTLVATERLKALSYARAADELQPTVDHEQPAMDAFAAVVGQHRREVAIHLMRTLGVEALAARRLKEFGVKAVSYTHLRAHETKANL